VEQPLAAVVVEAGVAITARMPGKWRWSTHCLPVSGFFAAVGQGGGHHAQVLGVDRDRALPGVEVDRHGRIAREALVGLISMLMARLRWLVSASDL
jgi:hypothetical protein